MLWSLRLHFGLIMKESVLEMTLESQQVATQSREQTIKKLILIAVRNWYKWPVLLGYNAYLITAITKTWHKVSCSSQFNWTPIRIQSQTPSFCDGVKLLTLITLIAYCTALYHLVLREKVFEPVFRWLSSTWTNIIGKNKLISDHLSKLVWSALITLVVIYSIYVSRNQWYRLVSGAGVLGFVLIGYAFSEHRKHIKWSQVLWGLALQFSLALIVLRTATGKQLFQCVGDKVTAFLKFTDEGSSFVFGHLVTGAPAHGLFPIFAFKVSRMSQSPRKSRCLPRRRTWMEFLFAFHVYFLFYFIRLNMYESRVLDF